MKLDMETKAAIDQLLHTRLPMMHDAVREGVLTEHEALTTNKALKQLYEADPPDEEPIGEAS